MEDQRTLDYLSPCTHEDGIARWSDTYAKELGRTTLLEANPHGLRGKEIPNWAPATNVGSLLVRWSWKSLMLDHAARFSRSDIPKSAKIHPFGSEERMIRAHRREVCWLREISSSERTLSQ